jgi:hypothetical protein
MSNHTRTVSFLVSLVAAIAALGAGCGSGKVTCRNKGIGGTTSTWSSCSDSKDRMLACAVKPGLAPGGTVAHTCTCMEAGIKGKQFEVADMSKFNLFGGTAASREAAYEILNQKCGWNLAP